VIAEKQRSFLSLVQKKRQSLHAEIRGLKLELLIKPTFIQQRIFLTKNIQQGALPHGKRYKI